MVLTRTGINLLQVSLDKDRSSQGTLRELALGVLIGVDRNRASLFLYANEHLGKEEALELLPRGSIAADAQRTVKSKLPKSITLSENVASQHSISPYLEKSRPCQFSTRTRRSSVISSSSSGVSLSQPADSSSGECGLWTTSFS